jgi:hypothetical protein
MFRKVYTVYSWIESDINSISFAIIPYSAVAYRKSGIAFVQTWKWLFPLSGLLLDVQHRDGNTEEMKVSTSWDFLY